MRTLPPKGKGHSAIAHGEVPSTLSRTDRKLTQFIRGDGAPVNVRGKTARIVTRLLATGRAGITQIDVVLITTRLAGIVYELRHRHGLCIAIDAEPNADGIGTHGRYRLITPLKVAIR